MGSLPIPCTLGEMRMPAGFSLKSESDGLTGRSCCEWEADIKINPW